MRSFCNAKAPHNYAKAPHNFSAKDMNEVDFMNTVRLNMSSTNNLVKLTGPGCSKLTTSLVKVLLKFQTLISEICQYFLLKKCEKLLHCKSFSHFFNKKYQCIWL